MTIKGIHFYSHYPTIKAKIEKLGLAGKVTFTGYVPDNDLVYLYNAAVLFVLPSLEEGFGLPAVEAMACGTPVVASNRGSLPEVLGNAGCFVDPCSVESLWSMLRDVIQSDKRRQEMRRSGIARSQSFTWDAAATKLTALFSEVAPS